MKGAVKAQNKNEMEEKLSESLAVDNPILNNPFEVPKEYWIYEEGQPKRMSDIRPAGYYF